MKELQSHIANWNDPRRGITVAIFLKNQFTTKSMYIHTHTHTIKLKLWKSFISGVFKKWGSKSFSEHSFHNVSKVILKILQAKLQQYVNWELPDVQAGFSKGRGTSYQHPLDHRKSKRIPEKHLLQLRWLHQSLWQCGSQQTMENSFFF